MSILAIAIPIGIIALVWVIFESAILKVFKMGGSSRNKGETQKNLKKEISIPSNIAEDLKKLNA